MKTKNYLMIFLLFIVAWSCNTQEQTKKIPTIEKQTKPIYKEISILNNSNYYFIGDINYLQGVGFVHNVGKFGLSDYSKRAVNQVLNDYISYTGHTSIMSVEGLGEGKKKFGIYRFSNENKQYILSNPNSSNWTSEMIRLGYDTYVVCDKRERSQNVLNLEYRVMDIIREINLKIIFSHYDRNGIPIYKTASNPKLSKDDIDAINKWYNVRMVQDLEYETCLYSTSHNQRIVMTGVAHILRLYHTNRIENFALAVDSFNLHEAQKTLAEREWLCKNIHKSYWP